jgi:hypothetical protein
LIQKSTATQGPRRSRRRRPARSRREARHAEVGAERLAAALGRKRRADERQAERHHERRPGALHGACCDQRADVWSQRARRRAGDEDAEADREHAPPAEPVAERGAGHQQHREAEVVRVHRPLELGDRSAQVEPDRAQRRRHDERVERHHQRCEGREREHRAEMSDIRGHADADTAGPGD